MVSRTASSIRRHEDYSEHVGGTPSYPTGLSQTRTGCVYPLTRYGGIYKPLCNILRRFRTNRRGRSMRTANECAVFHFKSRPAHQSIINRDLWEQSSSPTHLRSVIMGIRSSRPVDDFAELVHNIQHKPGEPEESYTKTRIEEGLKVVADHLHSKGLNVSIVTVGGAVNTVLLKTRASTGDVDFFYRTKDSKSEESKVIHEVVEGGKQAEQKLGLGQQWLNNHTVVFIEVLLSPCDKIRHVLILVVYTGRDDERFIRRSPSSKQ